MGDFQNRKNSFRYAQSTAPAGKEANVDPDDAVLQNPNAVIQIGTGERIFKKPVNGKVLNQVMTVYPSQADLNRVIKEALDKMSYNPNMTYSPQENQRFIDGIKEAIIESPIGGWLREVNPELFRG